ncbi:DUF5666 domain-containing protein [Lysobacter korlensis]|uniref:DUF5666 domain-containing protein n=1 Tax=Lysobacter korlensis TaxID=553636 RepID=A0ABV6RL01_9GAMM
MPASFGNRFSRLRFAAPLLALSLLAGCATPYGGGAGAGYPGTGYPGDAYPGQGYPGQGYPGQGYPGSGDPGRYGSQRVLGTVQQVDPRYGRVVISPDGGGYGGGRAIEVSYDRNTQLVYQGRQYPVEGLERGDRISIEAEDAGGRLHARFIEVVQNVRDTRGGGGSYYGNDLQGAISYVDPRRRVIELTRGGYSGAREQVFYDERTRVEYRGQQLRPEQLESGDVVRVQGRPTGQGLLAERIDVEVNARSR